MSKFNEPLECSSIRPGKIKVIDSKKELRFTIYDQLLFADRIVACVNACAGIENPAELREERDELLGTLIGLHKGGTFDLFPHAKNVVEEVIAKCGGEKPAAKPEVKALDLIAKKMTNEEAIRSFLKFNDDIQVGGGDIKEWQEWVEKQ